MKKNTLQPFEEANSLTKRCLEIRKELLKNLNFDIEPLSKGIEDYKKISERLEKLISEEYAKSFIINHMKKQRYPQ